MLKKMLWKPMKISHKNQSVTDLSLPCHLCLQTSVLHMCSLFHAFMFAQLWTIYCEQAAAASALQNQNQTEFSSNAILTGLEFWSRVTPSILQLMAHNKVVRKIHMLISPSASRGLGWKEGVLGDVQQLNVNYYSDCCCECDREIG